MRPFLPLFLIVVLITSLIEVKGQPIKPEGITTLHVSCQDCASVLPLSAQMYHIFPAYDFSEISDSLSEKRNQIWLHLPVRTAKTGYLFVGDEKLQLFMTPGDTVHVRVSIDSLLPQKFAYSFEGITKDENQYYLAKSRNFVIDPGQAAMNAGVNAKNLVSFQRQIDSLNRDELLFWNEYKTQHSLPAWFTRSESDAIRYSNAMLRLYMVWYQTNYQNKKQTVPTTYFNFLDEIPVRNTQAQYDYDYLQFLREYTNWKIINSGLPAVDTIKHQVANYQVVFDSLTTVLLGDSLGDFFRFWTMSHGVQNNPEVVRTELSQSKFSTQYDYLISYLRERSDEKSKILQAGDKAPAFFLTDTRDSLLSLSQFKGQVVYLCFWFSTCGGCYHEFPFENKLVDQFKGKPVRIVSICTLTKPDKWRETIKKVGLKTINLFANESWQKTLEEKYAISTYPHYVLIDADGQVVENFAARPSNNAAAKIEQVLEQMKHK